MITKIGEAFEIVEEINGTSKEDLLRILHPELDKE